jgi:hypothetical protein
VIYHGTDCRLAVIGKVIDASLEPARVAHVDYSLQGLRSCARYSRRDIAALAQEALEAEDADENEVPRYAMYSIWVRNVTLNMPILLTQRSVRFCP